jgi:PAS domain S-box-containing protein
MGEILERLFSSRDFLPHGHCYLWQPGVVWLHVISDSLIAAAYLTIPVTLGYFVKRRRDLPFAWIFWAFGVFIISCGTTHAMEVFTLWKPVYWLSGSIKVVTATASITTAVLLVPLVPRALALPSPSELRRAHEELRQTEARFRAATEGMRDAFYILESVRDRGGNIADFRVAEMNGAAKRWLGLALSAAKGQLYSEIADRSGHAMSFAATVRALETKGPVEQERKIEEGSDSIRWVREELVALGDGLAVTVREITDDKRHQEVLELHSAIVQSMSEGVCVERTSDGCTVYANPQFESMLGYDPGELDGRKSRIFQSVDALGRSRDLRHVVREQLSAQGRASHEATNLKKDGNSIVCRTTTCAIDHANHGEVWVAVAEDVTDRKKADEMVAHLAAIVESTAESIIGTTIDGRIASWNAGAERLYGYAPKEAIDQHISLLIPPELRERENIFLAQAGQGESTPSAESVRVHKNGKKIDVFLTASPMRNGQGDVIGVSTIAHDITERKLAEKAIADSLHEKEVLLREIHHRVKNHLQITCSLLKLHAERITDPVARSVFQDSQERVRSIALLHDKLYQSGTLGGVDAAHYTSTLMQAIMRAHGAAASAKVRVDAAGIYLPIGAALPCGLILNELVTNSLKHAFNDDRADPRVIQVRMASLGDDIELAVEDNGVGLPTDFDLNGVSTLGMRLVRMFAHQLGGEVEFSRSIGTRWSIRFPRRAGWEG